MESVDKNELLKQDFEAQFKNRESIDLFGTKFEIVDIHPEHSKTEVPVLIAPGWTEDMDSFKNGIRVLVEKGRRVICLEHPRHGDEMDNIAPDLKKLYPVEELRKAFALLAIIDQKGLDKVDVIAHSEGGINTAIAAILEVEKFKNIVFANSAGMIGPDNFPKLSTRFNFFTLGELKELIYSDDLKRQGDIQNIIKKLGEYISSNILRATKESLAIADVQIQDMIGFLHDEGVGVTILTSEDDGLFPPEKVKEVVDEKHVDHFMSLPGGHMEITKDPITYMTEIDKILSEDEAVKPKESKDTEIAK